MIGLDAHLLSLFNRDLISADEALLKSQLPNAMHDKLVELGARFTNP
jgi:twitching motility protein PilT